MSRLAGDCFAYGGERITVAEALSLLEARTAPMVCPETVPLRAAVGRCLAEPLVSPRDVPTFANSAVDGYAFAFTAAMRSEAVRLPLHPGRSAAGHPFTGTLPAGSALRVLTGGMMPDGADTVALQEEVTLDPDGAAVTIPPGLKCGANRRLAGEDVRRGQTVLAAGARLRPQEIGLAAELGRDRLSVFGRLEVAVLSTGDEIVEPGLDLPAGGVYDANRFILMSLLATLPVEIKDLGIVRDDPDTVREVLGRAAARHHVVLTSGGASRGDEDHVVRSVQAMGRLDFWQIAMKPGRPLAFGRLGEAVFVGLPGNPVASMVCFLLFARPVLLRLAGAAWPRPNAFRVPAAFAFRKKPGRSEYLRATLVATEAGLAARHVPREGSGILTSMVEAHGLVELGPEVERVEPGEPVSFLSFAELGITS
ncbi:gephyrin-like molybdotransferase Glp [Benzoatithermus flavus]|uniref:Molybdopterin molybdenumtransferase n=1 Tax=Benzoatithermus flavus TaxID=3108223 RepID=A0ABU8XRM9_9PROT